MRAPHLPPACAQGCQLSTQRRRRGRAYRCAELLFVERLLLRLSEERRLLLRSCLLLLRLVHALLLCTLLGLLLLV